MLFYKMLINRIFLRSRTGANPLPCETADTSTEYIYDVSKLVGMGKTPVFSSLRLAFLVKPVPPSHPQKEDVDLLHFISSCIPLFQEML